MCGFGGHGGQKNSPWARGHQGGPPHDQSGLVNFGGGQPPVFQGGPPGGHPGLAGLGPMGGPSAPGQQVRKLPNSTHSKSVLPSLSEFGGAARVKNE